MHALIRKTYFADPEKNIRCQQRINATRLAKKDNFLHSVFLIVLAKYHGGQNNACKCEAQYLVISHAGIQTI
jgi:hypothetical protein